MESRTLSPGLAVSELGLGCMGMSEFYGPPQSRRDDDSIQVIQRALARGCTFLDTADMYGIGHNETLVGRALQGRRDEAILATKFGIERSDDPAQRGINGRPEYVKRACDASLARLQTDHIDLYYQHRVDAKVPIEETVGAMGELVQAGKVRFLGLSEAAPETIRRAHATHPIAVLQTEYSLWSREPEDELLPTLRELGIGFVAYSPLGRGFLTGDITSFDDLAPDDYRRDSPRFQGGNFAKNLELVAHVRGIAAQHSATPGQIALAWLLTQGPDIVPIPGTKRLQYLEENLDAANLSLSAEDLASLDAAFPRDAAAGGRYPEAMAALVNR